MIIIFRHHYNLPVLGNTSHQIPIMEGPLPDESSQRGSGGSHQCFSRPRATIYPTNGICWPYGCWLQLQFPLYRIFDNFSVRSRSPSLDVGSAVVLGESRCPLLLANQTATELGRWVMACFSIQRSSLILMTVDVRCKLSYPRCSPSPALPMLTQLL